MQVVLPLGLGDVDMGDVDESFNTMVDMLTTRRCNGCDLCCTALEVEFDDGAKKPIGSRCHHLTRKGTCKIYDKRPQTCRVFYCSWRLSEYLSFGVPESMHPATCGFVLHYDRLRYPIMTLFPDPKRPKAWLKFKRRLEKLARNNNCMLAIGGGKEATHVLTPKGSWFARHDFPHLFADDMVAAPSNEFYPRRAP